MGFFLSHFLAVTLIRQYVPTTPKAQGVGYNKYIYIYLVFVPAFKQSFKTPLEFPLNHARVNPSKVSHSSYEGTAR